MHHKRFRTHGVGWKIELHSKHPVFGNRKKKTLQSLTNTIWYAGYTPKQRSLNQSIGVSNNIFFGHPMWTFQSAQFLKLQPNKNITWLIAFVETRIFGLIMDIQLLFSDVCNNNVKHKYFIEYAVLVNCSPFLNIKIKYIFLNNTFSRFTPKFWASVWWEEVGKNLLPLSPQPPSARFEQLRLYQVILVSNTVIRRDDDDGQLWCLLFFLPPQFSSLHKRVRGLPYQPHDNVFIRKYFYN